MEGDAPTPVQPLNPISSLFPLPPLESISLSFQQASALQPQDSNMLPPDVDWATLLSGPLGAGGVSAGYFPEQKALTGDAVETLRGRGKEEEMEENSATPTNNEKGKVALGRSKRKASRPRFAFQTRSPNDILDDGYRWRKYGQKAVKNSIYPRSYYRCTHHTCNVKKQVQRLSKDNGIVVTTYEGVHNHPCEKLMESLSPLLKQMQYLSRF